MGQGVGGDRAGLEAPDHWPRPEAAGSGLKLLAGTPRVASAPSDDQCWGAFTVLTFVSPASGGCRPCLQIGKLSLGVMLISVPRGSAQLPGLPLIVTLALWPRCPRLSHGGGSRGLELCAELRHENTAPGGHGAGS